MRITIRRSQGVIAMTDACSETVAMPSSRSHRWTSFVGRALRGRAVRGLEEEGNPLHRVRVEHNRDTLDAAKAAYSRLYV